MAEADFEAPLSKLQQQIDELAKWPGDREKEREAGELRQELAKLGMLDMISAHGN